MDYEAHPTDKKKEIVQELTDLFEQSKGLYLADFTGLNVEMANELRATCHKENVVYRVVKNTLIEHACINAGFKDLVQHLDGPTALAISTEDPVAPIRVLTGFVKNLEKKTPVIKAGMLENEYVGSEGIAKLKDIPPKEVLLAQILSCLQMPAAEFVGVLNEIVRSFVAVIQAVIDKKQAEESAK
jgi:large subunit ribosomal protein L10